MWLCMNNSFLSIVANRDKKDELLVRARLAGHIEAVFPKAKVFSKVGSDYEFRAFIPREEVAQVIAKNITAIKYDNFKSSVKSKALHDVYLKMWSLMHQLQERFLNRD